MADTLIASNVELTETNLDQFASRIKSLYSMPVVAGEVLELTSCPQVDTAALKACIERDPALTARLLRVVNSSLFGLSHPVGNLNQAITLLGIKPLKLLVLGFSLPEGLFANVAQKQLQWYWSTTLIRAIAAREISEQLFERPGDEAFLAGLLQDIGILALLGQFHESYSDLMTKASESEASLEELETESFGFDHFELSTTLLDNWNLPPYLGKAIANIRSKQINTSGDTSAEHLTHVLQLASLLEELVGRHRLSCLPELMELGAKYCNLDKTLLRDLVIDLQPKVEQLAEVLAVRLPDGRDYSDLLIAAHAQMSELAMQDNKLDNSLSPTDNEIDNQVLREVSQLRFAIHAFLQGPPPQTGQAESKLTGEESPQPTVFDISLERKLEAALAKCRSERLPLSVIMLEVSLAHHTSGSQLLEWDEPLASEILGATCREEGCLLFEMEEFSPSRRTFILPGCDRQEAVRLGRNAIQSIESNFQQNVVENGKQICVRAGVASAPLASKNFDSSRLLQTANRCLSAARSYGTSTVKSLEIY